VAVAQPGGELAALLVYTAALRPDAEGQHRLGLLVHPNHRGRAEAALLSRGLADLAAIPGPATPATARLYLDHAEAITTLEAAGFRRGRTLLTLSYPFQQERETGHGRL
jgi:hypothetical protein